MSNRNKVQQALRLLECLKTEIDLLEQEIRSLDLEQQSHGQWLFNELVVKKSEASVIQDTYLFDA